MAARLVVVDPRRSRTAEQADEWLPIRPGSDALLLAAIANTLFDEGLADPGRARRRAPRRPRRVRRRDWPRSRPRRVEAATGIDAATIRRLARELAAAPTAAVYGRIGTTTTEFGSTASWLDRRRQRADRQPRPAGWSRCSRCRSPAVRPLAAGPGTGPRLPDRSRALAGERPPRGDGRVPGRPPSPRRSSPRARARSAALVTRRRQPDAVDAERQPARRRVRRPRVHGQHRHVPERDDQVTPTSMLPVPSQLQRSHYDVLLLQFAVRNVANYSERRAAARRRASPTSGRSSPSWR